MRIADRVWDAWRSRAGEEEPTIRLLVAHDHDAAQAEAAVGESLRALQGAGDAPPGSPFPGEWAWRAVTGGVLVEVSEPDDLEAMLRGLAAALVRRGIEGSIDVYTQPPGREPPRFAHALLSQLRLRSGEAAGTVLAAGDRWCRGRGDVTSASLTVGTLGPIGVEPGENVVDRMHRGVLDDMLVMLVAEAGGRLRGLAAQRPDRCSLVIGCGLEHDGWRAPLEELTGLLGGIADSIDHASVMRGWAVWQTLLDGEAGDDWPLRREDGPRKGETGCAPDAFGVQVLGPALGDRLGEPAGWRSTPLGSGATLLEHADPAAWFDAPFVPLGHLVHPAERAVPETLARARGELAPILCS